MNHQSSSSTAAQLLALACRARFLAVTTALLATGLGGLEYWRVGFSPYLFVYSTSAAVAWWSVAKHAASVRAARRLAG